MKLQFLDIAIIAAYLVGTIVLGLLLRKRASENVDSYYLAGRKIPWWVLGMGGSSNYFDVTGTMLLVGMILTGGVKFILWGIHFGWHFIAMAVFMAYAGKWMRRSGVLTSPEWLAFRFGTDKGGRLARLTFAIFLIVFTVAVLVYTAVGMKKFFEVMMPGGILIKDTMIGDILITPKRAVVLLFVITGFYTTLAGMLGVAYNDVLQTLLITTAAVVVAVTAFVNVPAEAIQRALPSRWDSLQPDLGGASIFIFLFWLIRGTVRSMCGPLHFDTQAFLAARSARDAAKVAMMWNFSHLFRWVIVTGFIVLALGGMVNLEAAKSSDNEKVMPQVLQLMGSGTMGLLLAGMLAAFMSTFDSLINSCASFFVRDIYHAYIKPAAKDRELIFVSYGISIAVIVLSTVLSFGVEKIGTAWIFIILGLETAILFPNLLRWHWWRFNGYGYAAGVIVVLILLLSSKLTGLGTDWEDYVFIPSMALIGLTVCISVSLLTQPTSPKTLEEFARKTRPFGLWGPYSSLIKGQPDRARRLDFLNLFLCIGWYLSLNMMPVFFLLKLYSKLAIAAGAFCLLSAILYFTWWKTLPED